MEVKAELVMAKMSAFKARDVARHIQGMPALGALEMLAFYPQKSARLIGKTLKSAIANAENNNSLDPGMLVVKSALVNEGPTMRRFRPRARGSASPIRKRTSHIRIILEERDLEAEAAAKTAKNNKARKAGDKPGRAKSAKTQK